MPPIAPVRNEQGRMVTPPTLLPFCEVSRGAGLPNDYLQRESQTPDRSGTQRSGHADCQSDTAALRDTLRHLHTPQQQVFRIPFRAGRDRCGQPRLLRRSRQYAPSAIR